MVTKLPHARVLTNCQKDTTPLPFYENWMKDAARNLSYSRYRKLG